MVRLGLQRKLNLFLRLRVVSALQIVLPQLRQSVRKIRFSFQGFLQFDESFVELALLQRNRPQVIMSPCGRSGDSSRFLQPRKGVLVIFGTEEGGTQGQLAAWILRFQFKIFLEVWNCFRRIVPESRGGPHRIVIIRIFRFKLHRFFKRIPGFRNKA